MKIDFYLRFNTEFGQSLGITGNLLSLGNDDPAKSLPLEYFNNEFWHACLEIDRSMSNELHYQYVFRSEKGEWKPEAEKNRRIDLRKLKGDIIIVDSWNDPRYFENSFYTTPFREVFFKEKKSRAKKPSGFTHLFKVKAPLLLKDEVVCIAGNSNALANWSTSHPVLLTKNEDWWETALTIDENEFALTYKYGIYNTKSEQFVKFETGDNRTLYSDTASGKTSFIHDGFIHLPTFRWRGAGVAIPVFSLRSQNGFGIGEFADIKLLVDWAVHTGLKLIQLLPVNDTSATFTWKDSYPYAAISAFALHPIYINLQKVAGKKSPTITKSLAKKQKQLNQLTEVDYSQVVHFKMNILHELFELEEMDFLTDHNYQEFFETNKHWLSAYAAFCYLRDKNGTADFAKWRTHAVYSEGDINKLVSSKSKYFKQISFHYYVQYHLHLQLKESVDYAHKKGIAIKGDIPIGIYRCGSDAWKSPALYNLDMQAGAPPDDFAIKGQNWGFPTYNWTKMAEDHYDWWRQRFGQMSNYFDSFRIDHILGFFRIWTIPLEAVEGILGRFIPAIPVYASELGERGIWLDYDRFCKPYINDHILDQRAGGHSDHISATFLNVNGRGGYDLKPEFDTQRKVEEHFEKEEQNDANHFIKYVLFDLISNILMYEQPGSSREQFHFRIAMDATTSYQHLDDHLKYHLRELYINYFYHRQDEFWKQEALSKLPALKAATDMLICGEDLGMVPHTVPEVMHQLGILSLEIQRMPKNPQTEFFHPKDAPYLSVITPSSHDMSTVRGWWEENREKTQRFFNQILGEQGEAPTFCEPWVNRAIVLQHLYSPAMWSIFQLQDLLGMSGRLRRENPKQERINEPANSSHYWNYRMHIPLEDLVKEDDFNDELKDYVVNSGR